MSRRTKKSKGGTSFRRLLGWTVLLALVFSAGLITGERLVRKESLQPLVAVSAHADKQAASASDSPDEAGDEAEEPTAFSFFEKLSRGEAPSLSAARRADDKAEDETDDKAEKPTPRDDEPAQNETQPTAEDDSPEPADDEADSADSQESQPEKAPEKDTDKQLPARYTLQISAHPNLDGAKSKMAALRKRGLEPHVVAAEIPGKGKFYRVRVGKFHSMEEARTFQGDLKRKSDVNTFVTPL